MEIRRSYHHLAALLVCAIVASALALFAPLADPHAEPADALSGADFRPGRIIDDSIFFNSSSMSEAQVQGFLNAQMPNCVAANGWPCLKDLVTATSSRDAAGPGHCTAYQGAAAESAASIIVKVAQACRINPQVLVVMLQKEQGLVTATSPTERQYRVAMGYACPDTAACDSQYYGFANQVYMAAWQMRQYTNFPDRQYRIGAVSIQFHPNTACGSSVVDIANQATANLYNYTPYQPNAAALANLGGVGDACSSYGNRNFWVHFSNWFGPTTTTATVIPPDVPFGNFELGTTTIGSATVRGWALDPNTQAPIDVHLYVNGKWGGAFTADGTRLDVANAYPQFGPAHGFEFTFQVLPGTFEACIYGINVGPGSNQLIGCRVLSTPSGPPMGNIESAVLTDRTVVVSGWALDPDTAASIDIHIYVNGAWGGAHQANVSRPDVARVYPGYGDGHGFSVSLPVPVGTSTICVYGINVGAGYNQSIGCRTVSTASGPPFGNLESVTPTPNGARIAGWVIDPDTANPTDIHVYVDGQWGGAFRADTTREDVAVAYDGYGAAHGVLVDLSLPSGSSTVCVYAIDVLGTTNSLLGCQSVTRPSGSPFGSVDGVTGTPGSITVAGWVIDPDTVAPIPVHVYIDDAWAGAYAADVARPDVGRAYPDYGPSHGYQASWTVAAGTHQICVYAINVGIGQNIQLRCALVQS
jgi:hypothetical protein